MSTLDWLQLRRILESFNIAANVLVFRSNQFTLVRAGRGGPELTFDTRRSLRVVAKGFDQHGEPGCLALRRCIEEHISPANQDVPTLALASILRGVISQALLPRASGQGRRWPPFTASRRSACPRTRRSRRKPTRPSSR